MPQPPPQPPAVPPPTDAASDAAASTDWRALARLGAVAAVSGTLTGVVGAAFRLCLDAADRERDALVAWARHWPAVGWLAPVLAAALLVAVAYLLVQRFAPTAAGSGVQHVEAVIRDEAEPEPLAVLPVKFVGGVLAIGSGLILGREGPTVQMGATIGAQLGRLARLADAEVRTIQGASAGAGLAVAFNAPIGGVAFVVEELTKTFRPATMVAALTACATAGVTVRAILGNTLDFAVADPPLPTAAVVGCGLAIGALLGLLGAAYNRAVVLWLDRFAAIDRVPGALRAAAVGGAIGLVAWFEPSLVGGGEPLIQRTLDGAFPLSTLALLLVARWLLGPFSYSTGVPGGLFAPLLVVGAVVGAMAADLGDRFWPALGLSPTLAALVGMAAFFTAVVRAPLTGTLLVLGMTGTATPLLPMLAACAAAIVVTAALGSAPIYDTLRERMERGWSHPAVGPGPG